MSSSAIDPQPQLYQDPWEQEDEQLLQLCIQHEPVPFWSGLVKSNQNDDVKIRHDVDSQKPKIETSDDHDDDDDVVVVQQDPWAVEDEQLLQRCIQYDPWNNYFMVGKEKTKKFLDKQSSSTVGNLRRVSSVGGGLRRVSSRTQL